MPIDYAGNSALAADVSGSILGKTADFTLATVVDIGTSLWNSLPFTPEAKTEDLLAGWSRDALQMYNDNTDAVHTASLIGGALIPGAVSLKILGRARAGVTALGYSSSEIGASLTSQVRGAVTGGRQLALQKEIGDSFRISGAATAEYKNLTRQLLGANIGQNIADNAVIELAVVGTLNAHPYMEDYIKDPISNFSLSMAVGGVLGGALAIPLTNAAVRGVTGGIAVDTGNKILTSGYRSGEYKDLTSAAQYQRSTENLRVLNGILEGEPKQSLLRDIVDTLALKEGAAREKVLQNAVDGYDTLTPTLQKTITDFLGAQEHIGVDKIKFVNLDKVDVKSTAGLRAIDETDSLIENNKAVLAFARMGDNGLFEVFHSTGVRNAARAVDIKDAKKYITATGDSAPNFYIINKDRGENNLLQGISSARMDATFLKELYAIDKLTDAQRALIAVAPDDLPRMNAIVHLLDGMDATQLAKTEIKVTSDYPRYTAQKQAIEQTMGPDYWQKAARVVGDNDIRISNPEARQMWDDWVQGGSHHIATMRRAFDKFFRNTALADTDPKHLGILAKNIWEAGQGARDAFKEIADADGYVRLWRGINKDTPTGHAAVESYSVRETTSASFAAGKGSLHAFKVHVDNIIGVRTGEGEVLVGAPHNQIVNNLTIETAVTSEVATVRDISRSTVTADEFLGMYTKATQSTIQDMLKNGMSIEEISARTNTKQSAIQAVMAGSTLEDFATQAQWQRYTDPSQIDQYLNPSNKMFAIMGNPVKNPTGLALSRLDNNTASIAHREMVSQLTQGSGSDIAIKVLALYDAPEMRTIIQDMQSTLAEVNNALVGDPRWQSADNALRKLTKGDAFAYLGKQIIDTVDNMKKQFLEPIGAALVPMRDKPETLVELNGVFNKLAELRGWRDVMQDQTGVWRIMQMEKGVNAEGKTVNIPTPVLDKNGDAFQIVQPEVVGFLNSTRELTGQLYRTHNVNRVITGQAPLNDLGFWLPPLNLVNKSFAFVMDTSGASPVRLLVATKGDELESLITAFNASHNNQNLQVVRKGEQADYNILKGYTDYEAFTTYANVAYQHKGASSLAIVPTDTRMVENILQGYENLILQSSRKYAETYLTDSMAWLDRLSAYYRKSIESQPLEKRAQAYTKDSAITTKNILLGRDQLEQSPTLKKINTLVDTLISSATSKIDSFLATTNIDKVGTRDYYNQLNMKLADAGVTSNPMGSFQEYLAASVPQSKNTSHALISAGNGMMATLMLRMLELAQPAVNIMSLPILTSASLMEKLPKTTVNAAGDSMVFPLRAMYDGIRSMFAPERIAIQKGLWEPAGLINQTVRQYTEVLGTIHQAPLGKTATEKAIDALNNFQNSKAIKVMSSASDYAESFTRSFAMHTGFDAAKKAYPGIGDIGATIFASNFSDRAIGNYYAAQRPTLFQGSFGAGIGLFQTYFLTFAQSIYRGLEERNFKQLASLMLAQTGLFGIGSWPGFNLLSENIVSHFSDNHIDLTTGTFRAVNNPTAEMILYGLPSSLGPAFYTRGDISPRVPSTMTDIAVLNGVKEGYNALHNILSKTTANMGSGNATRALFEALSTQSLNRPIARWSELVTGFSIEGNGKTVSPISEVWTPMGITARLLATRPIEEQVTRNTIHLNKYYNAMDRDNQQKVMSEVKTAIRAGNLSGELLEKTAFDYLRHGGNAKGWRSALNNVLIQTPEGARIDLLRKLEDDSPLNKMIAENY